MLIESPNLSSLVAAARLAFSGVAWKGVKRRCELLPDLDPHTLLHAGPPLEGPPPAPVRNAAAQALVFEGQAVDLAQGLALVDTGAVALVAAQDYGVVTPLAQVVSHSMPLAEVGDEAFRIYAPLIEGAPPALRFGSLDSDCRTRLAAVSRFGLGRLQDVLASTPVLLEPVICEALLSGDDCHSRTDEAQRCLMSSLSQLEPEEAAFISSVRGFVLPILMAASAWAMRKNAVGKPHAIVAAGGNGRHFGIRIDGIDRWHMVAASAPVGTMFNPSGSPAVLGAIGDSAVIDFCGLGGQALLATPSLAAEWAGLLPLDALTKPREIVNADNGLVNARLICEAGLAPQVNLAMLDASGCHGLVGRGFYVPPVDLFASALAETVQTSDQPPMDTSP